ncbi:RNA polymerase sigma factor [Streptomyces sp. NPDC056527]|uniref:RNA polymerase sigma factor n=1 Tax=Streptomyces sp. NPDC056527 TaxID=3345853 RepID=UPI00369DF847
MIQPEDAAPLPGRTGRFFAVFLAVGAVLLLVAELYAATGSVALTAVCGTVALVVAVVYAVRHRHASGADAVEDADAALAGGPARQHGATSVGSIEEGPMRVGGSAAFDDFFRAEYLPLVRLLMQLGARYSEAEDAAAEAMSVVYEKWETITAHRAYARTTAIRLVRRRPRELATEIREQALGVASFLPSVEAGALDVLEMLRELPYEQRLVMALTIADHTPAEIAELAGRPVATVRSNLRHARSALRRMCQSDDRV